MPSAQSSRWLTPTRGATLGYFAAFILLGMASAALGPTITRLADNTGSTVAQISILFTARSLGFLTGAQVSGRLYDRWPGNTILIGGLILTGGTLLLTPIVPLLWLLTAVMFFGGMAESSIDVGGNTMLLWLYGEKAGPLMNGLHFFFGFGSFLAPILLAQILLATESLRAGYWTLAAVALPIMLFMLWLPNPRVRPPSAESDARKTAVSGLLPLLVIFLALYVGAEISFGGWIFTYAVAQDVTGEATAAYLTSGFWGALTVGRLLSVPMARLLPPRRMLMVALGGCLLSILVLGAWPMAVTAVWTATLGLGFFMSTIFPTTLAWAERFMPISGRVTSWFFTGASIGSMTIPWLIGQLIDRLGPTWMIVTIGASLLLEVAIFSIILRRVGQE